MAAKPTRKRKTTKKRNTKKQPNTGLKDEILVLAVFAACFLLMLGNFGQGSRIGGALSSLTFGLFGFMAYILPLILFGMVAFGISNRGNRHAYIKIGAFILLFLVFCTFFELITRSYDGQMKILDYYKISSTEKNGGGAAAGVVVFLLCPWIGVPGTYVVLAFLAAASVILITERSLLKPLGKGSRRAYEDMRRKQMEVRKQREEEREERRKNTEHTAESRKERRSDKKVAGVSFATTLSADSSNERISDAKESDAESDRSAVRKKKKGGSPGKDAKLRELTAPMPEKTEESLPSPFENFEINRMESSVEAEETISEHEPELDIRMEQKTRRKTKAEAAAVEAETAVVQQHIQTQEEAPKQVYRIPPMNLLTKGKRGGGDSDAQLRSTAQKLEQTLQNFGVRVHVTNASCGPAVTRYELQPEQGVKVSKIVGLADDIKLNLAAADIRIEAPIPGKAAVGIEVPNQENTAVMLRDLLESTEFKSTKADIPFAVGKDIAGKTVIADIAKMPHLLVAGATGSGKSVCINTLIMSILYHADPQEVKLIMVDPKVVELSVYNGIPHLLIPVVTDPKKAAGALNWAVAEMMKRYQLFAEFNVRDLKGYNDKIMQMGEAEGMPKKLPKIVIIVDELADLMMVAPGEVESAICRLAQLARAAGLHLIIATQRPSVNVITGLIKANMPSRIAFSVSSGVDSRTIIDMNGAEKLLGKGDMLFYPTGYPKPVRVQGSFVSDKEVQKVVDYLIEHNGNAAYSEEVEEHVNAELPTSIPGMPGMQAAENGGEKDAYFVDAGRLIIDKEKASIGMLQRMFKIGFNRAARIMDQLAEAGVVGEEEGTKPRKVLMTKEEFEQYIQEK